MRDPDGFDAFCVDAHPRLVGALAHHTGDRWLAEELAQEALVRAADRWDRVSRLSSPLGWCVHVGVNQARSTFRRRAAERRARARQAAGEATHAGGADEHQVAAAAVRDALALLTDDQREAVVLRHLLGLSVAETADVVGATETAVRARTSRGIALLRDRLGPDLLVRDVHHETGVRRA